MREAARRAIVTTIVLAATLCAIAPFSRGHSLHKYTAIGKFLVSLAEAEFLWFGVRWGYVYNVWQSARETRREVADAN